MAKHILFLDAETFYDRDFTLRLLTPPEYILDGRFHEIMWACAVDDGPVEIIEPERFPAFLSRYPAADTTTVTFNSLFDNAILSYRHNYVPAVMNDVMGMGRALYGHALPGSSLATMLDFFQAPVRKGNAIHNMVGISLADYRNGNAQFRREFEDYARADVEGMRWLWAKFIKEFPREEKEIMNLVLRCAVIPSFRVDAPKLRSHLDKVKNDKVELLERVGLDKADLMSNQKFQAVLENLGVEVEMKQSTTGNTIPAFAKTDEFMQMLLEHDDEEISSLAAARLGFKSTIEETRAERLLAISGLPWGRFGHRATMPFPLRYGGAHTHRLSGEWKINLQNLPRGSVLRDCLVADWGQTVLTIDLAQIEARITGWLCEEEHLIDEFRRKGDPYSALASRIFGFVVNKRDHPWERFIGKAGVLGLGFGCGAEKFYNMVVRGARAARMPLTNWTPELAQSSVTTYRELNARTVATWRRLQCTLDSAWTGVGATETFGPVEIGYGAVTLPTGIAMRYKPFHNSDGELSYRYGKRVHRMYGPKFLENIVQALARCVVMQAALRLSKQGFNFVGQAHDELIFLLPTDVVEEAKPVILRELVRPPTWAAGIPLDAEIGTGKSYGEAK